MVDANTGKFPGIRDLEKKHYAEMMNGRYSSAQIDQELQATLFSLAKNHDEEITKDLLYKPNFKNVLLCLYTVLA